MPLDLPPLPHPWPRRLHVYVTGLFGSGTTSVARMFSRYDCWHNFKHRELAEKLGGYRRGDISKKDLESYLAIRHHAIWADVDAESCGSFPYCIEFLAALFPKAKFILVLRDCYSWCDYYLNHLVNHGPHDFLPEVLELSKDREEYILANIDFILDRVLSLWKEHVERVVEGCSPNRLLVLRTDHISSSIGKIAQFVGVPEDMLLPGYEQKPVSLDFSSPLWGPGGGGAGSRKEQPIKFAKKRVEWDELRLWERNRMREGKYDLLQKISYPVLKRKFESYCSKIRIKFFPEKTLEGFLSRSDVSLSKEPALLTPASEKPIVAISYLRQAEKLVQRGARIENINTPEPWLERASRLVGKKNYREARKCLVQFENLAEQYSRADLRNFLRIYIGVRRGLQGR